MSNWQLLEDIAHNFHSSNPADLAEPQSLQYWEHGRELTRNETGEEVWCEYYYDGYYVLYQNANLDKTDEDYGWIGMIRKDTPSLTYWHVITDTYPSQFSAYEALVEAVNAIKSGEMHIDFSD